MVIHESIGEKNLFSLGIDFIDLKINENHLGVYALIGQISMRLIRKNEKELSPIIGFDSELWIQNK